MANTHLPSADVLRNLLSYDPLTGDMVWRERTNEGPKSNFNLRWAGKPALTSISQFGYRRGTVNLVSVLAHRAIWAMVTGSWPQRQIDHINGDKTDNRWTNLREVGHALNGRNAKKKTNNTSGVTGVYWASARQKWHAEMTVDRRKVSLGNFNTLDEAKSARRAAEALHGFTETHGRRD